MNIHKVIIIGSGPAGYSASIYTARALLNPILFEGSYNSNNSNMISVPGGQLTTTSTVENFLGFKSIGGYELTEQFKEHAISNNVIIISKNIISVDFSKSNSNKFILTDEDGENYYTDSVIIATGASANKLGIINEKEFWHHGISACAVCDGSLPMFRNKPIAVVGGGDSAFEEALYLSKYASKVFIIHRKNTYRASKIMIERAQCNNKIEFITYKVVLKAEGTKNLERITLLDILTQKQSYLEVNGLFYAVGHTPNTSFLKKSGIELDNNGYITIHDNVKTNIPGIFAAGDVCDKVYRQAITAAGSGCMAALETQKWLESQDQDIH